MCGSCRHTDTLNGADHGSVPGHPRRTTAIGPKSSCEQEKLLLVSKLAQTKEPLRLAKTSEPPEKSSSASRVSDFEAPEHSFEAEVDCASGVRSKFPA